MPVFYSQFKVQAPIRKVFSFHRNAHNLSKVQPPYPRVLSLRCPEILHVGDRVEIELGPVPRQFWTAQVEELSLPHGQPERALMIDSALRGPFPFFRHRHVFVAEGNDTWIKDTIDFDPPLGKWGWFLLPGIYLVLYLMFRYRRTQTQLILEKE
jgi:ligand-binding SRPBCC domain-containing protein